MLEVQFIGTGDAFCSGGRRNSALLVRDRGHTLLLDCGPTTLGGLKALGIDPLEIDAIAISHFHGDHAAGTPFLLLDYLVDRPRTRPLEILGPPGIEAFTRAGSAHFHFDIEVKRRYELTYREFEMGTKLETLGFSVVPLPAHHYPDTLPHMLRVESGRRAVLFTGDTAWHDGLPGLVGEVDLLISECTLMEDGPELHLSHDRLRRERSRFDCARMIVTHLGQSVLDHADSLELDTAHDGLRLEL